MGCPQRGSFLRWCFVVGIEYFHQVAVIGKTLGKTLEIVLLWFNLICARPHKLFSFKHYRMKIKIIIIISSIWPQVCLYYVFFFAQKVLIPGIAGLKAGTSLTFSSRSATVLWTVYSTHFLGIQPGDHRFSGSLIKPNEETKSIWLRKTLLTNSLYDDYGNADEKMFVNVAQTLTCKRRSNSQAESSAKH